MLYFQIEQLTIAQAKENCTYAFNQRQVRTWPAQQTSLICPLVFLRKLKLGIQCYIQATRKERNN